MTTQAERRAQRIPFGTNGIKDGNGRVIRTDHPSFKGAVGNIFDSSPTREEMLNRRINKAVDGDEVSSADPVMEEMKRNRDAIYLLLKG